jgi:hypothetical protein
MLTLQTRLHVAGLRGRDVFDFLLSCTDEQYRRWWPGTHLRFHTLERRAGHVGNRVVMDEYVGRRRLRLTGVVREAVQGSAIVWQLGRVVLLPVWLRLDLADDGAGVTITHTVRAGVRGLGAVVDPLLRRYFSEDLARDLDAHVRTEFPKLREVLSAGTAAGVEQASSNSRWTVGHGVDGLGVERKRAGVPETATRATPRAPATIPRGP